MHCPICQQKTRVVDSRLQEKENITRRRRECESCSFRFSTVEQVEILDLQVIKKNSSLQSYDRGKLERGVQKALEKRPVTQLEFQEFMSEVEQEIMKKASRGKGLAKISVKQIGEIVLSKLKNLDEVAYILFASVYRSFDDIKSFEDAIHVLDTSEKDHEQK